MEREKLYMLAIMPPPAVRREIEEVRNAFAHTYGCKAAMKHQVHVTLYPPFKTATADEAEIEKALLQGLATLEHFVINVKGFDSFIRNEVIFLKVELSEPLKELHKEISNILAGRLQPAPRKDQPYHPHITIVKRQEHFPLRLSSIAFCSSYKVFQGDRSIAFCLKIVPLLFQLFRCHG